MSGGFNMSFLSDVLKIDQTIDSEIDYQCLNNIEITWFIINQNRGLS